MKTRDNEILVYYDRENSQAKKVLAYARSVTRHVQEVEYHRTPFTPTMWRQLLERLGMQPKHLLNKAHPYYQLNVRGRDFSEEDWLNVLIRNPDLIKAPIVVRGRKAILANNPQDVLAL
jgi:arsenate reductase